MAMGNKNPPHTIERLCCVFVERIYPQQHLLVRKIDQLLTNNNANVYRLKNFTSGFDVDVMSTQRLRQRPSTHHRMIELCYGSERAQRWPSPTPIADVFIGSADVCSKTQHWLCIEKSLLTDACPWFFTLFLCVWILFHQFNIDEILRPCAYYRPYECIPKKNIHNSKTLRRFLIFCSFSCRVQLEIQTAPLTTTEKGSVLVDGMYLIVSITTVPKGLLAAWKASRSYSTQLPSCGLRIFVRRVDTVRPHVMQTYSTQFPYWCIFYEHSKYCTCAHATLRVAYMIPP